MRKHPAGARLGGAADLFRHHMHEKAAQDSGARFGGRDPNDALRHRGQRPRLQRRQRIPVRRADPPFFLLGNFIPANPFNNFNDYGIGIGLRVPRCFFTAGHSGRVHGMLRQSAPPCRSGLPIDFGAAYDSAHGSPTSRPRVNPSARSSSLRRNLNQTFPF